MTVRQVLAEKGGEVVTLSPTSSLAEAAHMLAQRRIGAVVVSADGGRVDGILSERDIVRAIARDGASALDAPVEAWMTREVVTCAREVAIDDLMQTMTQGKFRHVPVVEDGRLVGIVSIGDVVKRRVAAIEAEAQMLKEYIAG
ncbi:CBS domain-containing protein [Salinarimonas ramus]|uniref:Inosine-5-monophosphate dehydrogenase n=1 Tax=Salinarimonas ramus TaxID=690164 RepID=A0A917QK26_9HYPH|nr:CBS domain-containing protein [Salinarimonas ramus]GGK54287.1 inosine-5-monophosphate dehydrogenase [Salinarimonas ramus]